MKGYVRLGVSSGKRLGRPARAGFAILVRAALAATALVAAHAHGSGPTADAAVVAAQLEYQESRLAAWEAAARSGAAAAEAAERAIVRAQREYQASRSLAWWRAQSVAYAGNQCVLRSPARRFLDSSEHALAICGPPCQDPNTALGRRG